MMNGSKLELLTTTGDKNAFKAIEESDELVEFSLEKESELQGDFKYWNGHLLVPLVYDDPKMDRCCWAFWVSSGNSTGKWMRSISIPSTY